MDESIPPRNLADKFFRFISNTVVDGPITWIRENFVERNRPTYYWYHRKYNRVPTIDQCYTDDIICCTEADLQYKIDRRMEGFMLVFLKRRADDCRFYEGPDANRKCGALLEDYEQAAENWFIKYGDMSGVHTVEEAYMKQKHRLLWERRHGKVGTGMREQPLVE